MFSVWNWVLLKPSDLLLAVVCLPVCLPVSHHVRVCSGSQRSILFFLHTVGKRGMIHRLSCCIYIGSACIHPVCLFLRLMKSPDACSFCRHGRGYESVKKLWLHLWGQPGGVQELVMGQISWLHLIFLRWSASFLCKLDTDGGWWWHPVTVMDFLLQVCIRFLHFQSSACNCGSGNNFFTGVQYYASIVHIW